VVTISREEVLEMLKSTPVEKRDFVLVDLRRNDFEVSYGHQNNRVVWIPPHFSQNSGNKHQHQPFRHAIQGGTIRGSINLPAQSLPLTLSSVYATLKAANLRKVIFYCGLSP
jgi:arsenical-resistance protein 2